MSQVTVVLLDGSPVEIKEPLLSHFRKLKKATVPNKKQGGGFFDIFRRGGATPPVEVGDQEQPTVLYREDANFAMNKKEWALALAIYEEHREEHRENASMTHINLARPTAFLLRGVELTSVYRMLRAAHFYESSLLTVALLKTLDMRLLALSMEELFAQHREVRPRAIDEYKTQFTSYRDWINGAYAVKRLVLKEILKTYLGSDQLLRLAQSYLPSISSVCEAGDLHSALIAQSLVYVFGDALIEREQTVPTPPVRQLAVPQIISLWCGARHTMFLTTEGLMALGGNGAGELGLGGIPKATDVYRMPQKVPLFEQVLLVSCGRGFTLILATDGLYGTGSNQYGQLGLVEDESLLAVSSPQRILFQEEDQEQDALIVAMSAGGVHSMVVTLDGLFIMGTMHRNPKIATDIKRRLTRVSGLPSNKKVVAVASGESHALVVLQDGTLHVMGSNQGGALGLPGMAFLDRFNSVTLLNNRAVAAGTDFSLTRSGDYLYSVGKNEHAQLGLSYASNEGVKRWSESLILNVIQPVAGHAHGLTIAVDGLWVFGLNTQGQLGLSGATNPTIVKPMKLGLALGHEKAPASILLNAHHPMALFEAKNEQLSTSLRCAFCGCEEMEKLGYHEESEALYCLGREEMNCFLKYQSYGSLLDVSK